MDFYSTYIRSEMKKVSKRYRTKSNRKRLPIISFLIVSLLFVGFFLFSTKSISLPINDSSNIDLRTSSKSIVNEDSISSDTASVVPSTESKEEKDKVDVPVFETITLADGRKVKRLKPKASYESNGYHYNTDSIGRIIAVKGVLRLEKGVRNAHSQKTVGEHDGRMENDHGGHLIASQFGGSGKKENLVPMNSDVNNYHSGEWGQMEKNWAKALRAGKEVRVNIELIYEDITNRPSGFKVTEIINGNTAVHVIFNE